MDTNLDHEKAIRLIPKEDKVTIEDIAMKFSIIPGIYEDKDKQVTDVIFCESMAGGVRFANGLPEELTLIRLTKDNKKYVEQYTQNTIAKPHRDLAFVNNDRVFIKNIVGETGQRTRYFQLTYEQSIATWILIPYTDKTFTTPLENSEGKVVADHLSAYGYEKMQRCADFKLDELD
jgi:hypothetical protein